MARSASASSPSSSIKIDPGLGHLGVLLEPASILAKAWDHTWHIGRRSRFVATAHAARHRRRADRLAGGPDGRTARVSTFTSSITTTTRQKPIWSQQLGGTYHTDGIEIIDRLRPDILMECTGAPALIVGAARTHRAGRDRLPGRRHGAGP